MSLIPIPLLFLILWLGDVVANDLGEFFSKLETVTSLWLARADIDVEVDADILLASCAQDVVVSSFSLATTEEATTGCAAATVTGSLTGGICCSIIFILSAFICNRITSGSSSNNESKSASSSSFSTLPSSVVVHFSTCVDPSPCKLLSAAAVLFASFPSLLGDGANSATGSKAKSVCSLSFRLGEGKLGSVDVPVMNEISSGAPPVAPCSSLSFSIVKFADALFGSVEAGGDVVPVLLAAGGDVVAVLSKEMEDTGAERVMLSSIVGCVASLSSCSLGATSISFCFESSQISSCSALTSYVCSATSTEA
mmetsp:Transcript_30781/g.37572  ORF Transcript_30781/g.37572 Transcript_30781/m.37572 type:complete len:310 (-) Transcript_30781:171-1100(-)